jgi:two-component system, LytTR family, response regulator
MYNALTATQQPIQLSVTEGTFHFQPSDIVRLEASSNYTYIHFTNRRPLLIARVLRDFEAMLGQWGFVRTHRSHLVNKAHISHVDAMGWIVMRDASRAGVSRRKRGVVDGLNN